LNATDEPAFAELADGLREARARGPSEAQRARMRAALGLPAANDAGKQSGSDGAQAAPAPAAQGLGAAPALLKLVLLGALGIAAAYGVARIWPGAEPAAPRTLTAPAPPPPSPVNATPAEHASAAQPRAAEPAQPSRVAAPSGAGASGAAATQPRRERATVDPKAHASAAADGDPAQELALLKRAKSHARSAPQRALALLAEHERRFARGTLVEEREVIAVEALLAAGERAQAERRAAAFLERFPDSAHARRVRALLAQHSTSDPDTIHSAPSHPGG
jgi:hypothetical protein